MATGPGTGGQGAGLGGGGPRGVRSLLCLQGFPQQWLLRSFLLLLLGSPRRRLCLCLQAARPLSPGQQAPPPGHQQRQGPALTLTHTRTRTDTRSARRLPSFSPFLSLPPHSLSPSRSQNEAPGRAEGGAAPTGPAPLPARQEEEGGSKRARQAGRTAEKNKRETETGRDRGPDGEVEMEQTGSGETWMEGRPVGTGNGNAALKPQVGVLRGEVGSQSHRQGWRKALFSLEISSII